MNNTILHLISNRPGPFNTPLFSQTPTFVPLATPVPEQELRALLLLDNTETDYYLKVYLAVLSAYPDWKQQFGGDLQESYVAEEILPRGVYITGADMPGGSGGPGLFTDPPVNTFPVELHYRIIYLGDNLCQITGLHTGVRYNATLTMSGDDPEQIIRIAWPDAVPFSGPLQLTQPWVLGAVIDILVQPSNFPFAQLVAQIQGNAYLQGLMVDYGISSAFNETADPVEQTAMAIAVLGLMNQTRLTAVQATQVPAPVDSSVAGWMTAPQISAPSVPVSEIESGYNLQIVGDDGNSYTVSLLGDNGSPGLALGYNGVVRWQTGVFFGRSFLQIQNLTDGLFYTVGIQDVDGVPDLYVMPGGMNPYVGAAVINFRFGGPTGLMLLNDSNGLYYSVGIELVDDVPTYYIGDTGAV